MLKFALDIKGGIIKYHISYVFNSYVIKSFFMVFLECKFRNLQKHLDMLEESLLGP